MRTCRYFRGSTLLKRCTIGRVTRCSYYRDRRVYKRCVSRNVRGKARVSCRWLRRSRSAPARPRALNSQFYSNPSIASVGRLYPARCTATMVTRTIAVTAAHCLYRLRATTDGPAGWIQNVSMYPGMTWGQGSTEATAQRPYGQWVANNWWVPPGYQAGDEGLDWGLVEFRQTTADGRYLGDVVGQWSITYNLQWNTGARIQGVGYPAEGFWDTIQGHFGTGQYVCDSTWDGFWRRLSDLSPSNTAFVYTECTMNGGSSGGPWFVQLSDGSWTIGLIEDRGSCDADKTSPEGRCIPWARYALGAYLDDRFIQFWNSVVPG